MARPPRNPKAPLFGKSNIIFSLLCGLVVLIAALLVFGIALYRAQTDDASRAVSFVTLVIGMLVLLFANRSRSGKIFSGLRSVNWAFWWLAGGALTFLGAVLYVPSFSRIFHFAALSLNDLAICFGAGLTSGLIIELIKIRRPPT
jgi:Ca2+-transporting ATPase